MLIVLAWKVCLLIKKPCSLSQKRKKLENLRDSNGTLIHKGNGGKMNEEIDDSEFYHEDFTTASDWEILVAHMEEIVNQWKNEQLEQTSGEWIVKSEKLVYMDTNFDFTYYDNNLEEDKAKHVLDRWFDFSLVPLNHKDVCLAQWFGVNKFIVISSSGDVEQTNNESRMKTLLSAVTVLASNVPEVPIFVQVRDKWQKTYCGVYESNGIRTNFDVVHLARVPYHCQYLVGLLDVFKTKIRSPCSIEEIFVSYKATYQLQDFGSFAWKQEWGSDVDMCAFFALPFGVTIDPVSSLYLDALWSYLPEHSVIDSEHHTDFKPLKAQQWQCSVLFINNPVCLLSDCLGEVREILYNDHPVYSMLGSLTVLPDGPKTNPLDLLTEPLVPSISTLVSQATRNNKGMLKA